MSIRLLTKTPLFLAAFASLFAWSKPAGAEEPCIPATDSYSHRSDAGARPLLSALVPTLYLRIYVRGDRDGDATRRQTPPAVAQSRSLAVSVDGSRLGRWEVGLMWNPGRLLRRTYRPTTPRGREDAEAPERLRELCRRLRLQQASLLESESDFGERLDRELLRRELRALDRFYDSH